MIYRMGYSGHGAQLATLMGEMMADQMMGRNEATPGRLAWPAVPAISASPGSCRSSASTTRRSIHR